MKKPRRGAGDREMKGGGRGDMGLYCGDLDRRSYQCLYGIQAYTGDHAVVSMVRAGYECDWDAHDSGADRII